MIADLGTRRGTTLEDINRGSQWINSLSWMNKEVEDFPMKTVRELSLSSDEVNQIKEEILSNKEFNDINTNQQAHSRSIHHKGNIPEEVTSRFRLSNYILNPNKFLFSKVIRIVALVFKFIYLLKSTKINEARRKSKGLETATDKEIKPISEKDRDLAEDYYFIKASLEVRNFVKEAQYTKFSKDKDDKLLYTGQILPTNSTSITGSVTNTMQDLSVATFCVPILDKHSPLTYAIINDIHWNDKVAQHSGIERVWTYVLK